MAHDARRSFAILDPAIERFGPVRRRGVRGFRLSFQERRTPYSTVDLKSFAQLCQRERYNQKLVIF